MADFIRKMDEELIGKLKEEELFQLILKDISMKRDAVFPAIRNESISFYYKGGGIFTYGREGFKTNKKYCFVPEEGTPTYMTENVLETVQQKKTFLDAYEDIKERCKVYGGIEADTISSLYRFSGASDSEIILLDTEVCFGKEKGEDIDSRENRSSRINRIDLLLYDTKKQELCFCEAKHFVNSEIWAKEGNKPKVCEQIARYNEEIRKHHDEIIAQYVQYISIFNKLFNTKIPTPESVRPKTGLIVFGYDSYQQEKLKNLLINDGSLDGIPYYFCQTPDNICKFYASITK